MAGKSMLPENATDRQKFVYYANVRGKAALKAIDNLGALATNKAGTKADVDKLEKALVAAVAGMRAKFDNPGTSAAAAGLIE